MGNRETSNDPPRQVLVNQDTLRDPARQNSRVLGGTTASSAERDYPYPHRHRDDPVYAAWTGGDNLDAS
jgi:hypothetical protein